MDDSGKSIFFQEGFGKPSSQKTLKAFGTRIEPGSHVFHDLERSHNSLAKMLALHSERNDAKLLKGTPDGTNPLEPVNRMCFLLKSFLRLHSGFDRDDMQGYLNLFRVVMNEPEDKMEKEALSYFFSLTKARGKLRSGADERQLDGSLCFVETYVTSSHWSQGRVLLSVHFCLQYS